MNRQKRIYLALVFLLIFHSTSWADGINKKIDLKAIRMIESSDCKDMYNMKSGAIGCYQITKIVVDEWNNFHKVQYAHKDMMDKEISGQVANWYLNERIPAMLKYYKKEVTLENILIAYNYGIKHVKEDSKLPKETRDYIEKYKKLKGE